MHKGPDPTHYERKDFGAGAPTDAAREPMIVCNSSKNNVSKNKRVLYGFFPKGQRRSCIQPARGAAKLPGPGEYHPKEINKTMCFANKLNPRAIKITPWDKETMKSVSKKVTMEEIGPGQYKPNFEMGYDRQPVFSVPKELCSNFLDKAVRERMQGTGKNRVPLPGPGQYDVQNFPLHKTSRGTFHSQLRGLSRNPASGYL
jgi:hypothetical protein